MPQTRDSWEYDDDDTVLYKTDYYGGSHSDLTNTERFSDNLDLTVYTGAILDFKFLPSCATDNLIITIYKRRDANWTGNELAWKSALTVENNGNEREYPYTIPKDYQPGHYRFGMKSSGATTSFDMIVSIRKWRLTNTKA